VLAGTRKLGEGKRHGEDREVEGEGQTKIAGNRARKVKITRPSRQVGVVSEVLRGAKEDCTDEAHGVGSSA